MDTEEVAVLVDRERIQAQDIGSGGMKRSSGPARRDARIDRVRNASCQDELIRVIITQKPYEGLSDTARKKSGQGDLTRYIIPATFDLIYSPTRVINGDRSLLRNIII